MMEIVNEDECNDTYGRMRMYYALKLKHEDDNFNVFLTQSYLQNKFMPLQFYF